MNEHYRPRRDVTDVRLQGGYVAKQCPLRVHYDAFPPAGAVPMVESPIDRLRMDAGITFEAEVFAAIRATLQVVVDLSDQRDPQATSDAMARGAEVILAARLPADQLGRRVGHPDVLVRDGRNDDGRWGYHPIDVKHHMALSPIAPRKPPALVSELDALALGDADVSATHMARSAPTIDDDLLQLAHYHRMLEACGHATPDPFGAIIGSEGCAVWHRLDVPVHKPRWDGMPKESSLDRYDFEFSFRLDVLAAGSAGQRIVEPVSTALCTNCGWEPLCTPQLKAADSASLLPRQGYESWRTLQRAGVPTRAAVASLDHADAVTLQGFDAALRRKLTAALADTSAADDAALSALIGKSQKATDAGLVTVGDLRRLDPVVVRLAPVVTKLPDLIDHARVATQGAGRPHRRRGVEHVVVPQFDIELDIDMENAMGGAAYLWGAFDGRKVTTIVDWDEPDPMVEARVFCQFWDWLVDRRHAARRDGQTFGIFCWNETAEKGALRRGATAAATHLGRHDATADVEELFASGDLIDLMKVFDDQLMTGGSKGLKAVAPMAGFAWDDDEAGGDNSMAWHDEAVNAERRADRSEMRDRLVRYNADDVRATAAVRHWIRHETFPRVESLG